MGGAGLGVSFCLRLYGVIEGWSEVFLEMAHGSGCILGNICIYISRVVGSGIDTKVAGVGTPSGGK